MRPIFVQDKGGEGKKKKRKKGGKKEKKKEKGLENQVLAEFCSSLQGFSDFKG